MGSNSILYSTLSGTTINTALKGSTIKSVLNNNVTVVNNILPDMDDILALVLALSE